MAFSLFSKEIKKTHIDSALIILLKKYVSVSEAILFQDVNIYYHQDIVDIPLLILLPKKGILLLEAVDWKYESVKDATVSEQIPSSKQISTIEVDSALHAINQKFNEILHTDLNITKGFILFNQLNETEFDLLDESFHKLIPKSRALFSNETLESITEKIEDTFSQNSLNYSSTEILSSLFMQYTLLSDKQDAINGIANEQQKNYVDTNFSAISTLVGPYGSGKSTLMLLKVLAQKLSNPKKSILIIEPTHIACEIMMHRLLNIIEYAIVDIDLSTIEIITPKKLLERHMNMLYKKPLEPLEITKKMMKKKFNVADIIICDDIELLSQEFIFYLIHIQKGRTLHFISAHQELSQGKSITLSQSYRINDTLINLCKKDLSNKESYKEIANIKFSEGNIYMKTILAFNTVLKLKESGEKCLIITPNRSFAHALFEEMHEYVEEDIALFDANKSIANQAFDQHLIVQCDDMASLQAEHVIVSELDPNNDPMQFCYALGRATKNIHVIFNDKDFHDVNLELKDFFE